MRRNWVRRCGLAVAAGLIVSAVVAGCSGGGSDTPSADPSAGAGATAPGGGSVTENVAPVEPEVLDPVGIADPADVDGITIRIDSVEKITLDAKTPGDVAGPALAVTVSAENTTQKPVDVSSAVVVLTLGDGTAPTPSGAEPAAPLSGTLEPSKTAQGVYVFSYQGDIINPVTVTVNHSAGAGVAVFTGDIS